MFQGIYISSFDFQTWETEELCSTKEFQLLMLHKLRI